MPMYDYLPDWIQEFYRKRSNRKKVLEKYGEKAFLVPDQLKFPVVDPKTGKYHCGLLLAAYVRANQWKSKKPIYGRVAKKAKELYEKQDCESKLKINLENFNLEDNNVGTLKESTNLALPDKEYKKIKAFLSALFLKDDGTRTKFARKYNVKGYEDFYRIFKELKQDLKSDREGIAFGVLTDMAKTYVGKIWRSAPGGDPQAKTFNSWIITLQNVALVLDNLKVLKKALAEMEKEYQLEKKASKSK